MQVLDRGAVKSVRSGLFEKGVLARPSQVTFLPQSGDFTLVLEGVARAEWNHLRDGEEGFLSAVVTATDESESTLSAENEMDPAFSAAEKRLRGLTAQLLQAVSDATGAPTEDVLDVIARVPASVAADIVLSVLCGAYFPPR